MSSKAFISGITNVLALFDDTGNATIPHFYLLSTRHWQTKNSQNFIFDCYGNLQIKLLIGIVASDGCCSKLIHSIEFLSQRNCNNCKSIWLTVRLQTSILFNLQSHAKHSTNSY